MSGPAAARWDRLFRRGQAPDAAELAGREFRGRNLHPLARRLGVERFRKGFVRRGGGVVGYNRLPGGARLARVLAIAGGGERPFLRFRVLPARLLRRPLHPEALAIHYRSAPGRHPASPVGLVVDYLVRPDPSRPDLLLGKSYAQAGPVRIFLEHFLLERTEEPARESASGVRRPRG